MTDTGSSANADEESTPDETDDDAPADGLSAPGGGPTRVVSSRSVDDILDSLDETPAATDPAPKRGRKGEERAETATDGRASAPDAPADDDDDSARDGGASTDANAGRENREKTGDDESVALECEEETEGLSGRVDAGTVTGADVRAAEAGEGRERTPEIDEIDLSLDDLDDLEAPAGSADPTASGDAGDAGPLAGAIPREETTPATADDDSLDDAESAGLLGRLKRLFSR